MKTKQLPTDWKEVELGEICEIYQPKTISSKDLVQNGKYLVFGANGIIGKYDKYNHENSEVLVTCRGATCGTLNFSKPFSWITGNAMIITPKKELFNFISKKFLFYLLKAKNLKDSLVSGSAQPQITRMPLVRLKIPLPPLPVQKKIVSILEKAEQLKQQREQADKLTKEYLQSVFYEMFENKDFPVEILKNIVSPEKNSLKRGPFGGSLKKEIFVKQGFKVYEQKNAIYNNVSLGDYFIIPKKFEEMKDFSVKPGDFIISCSGTMGKIAIIPKNAPEGIINQALLKITLDKNKIDSLYFKFLFQSKLIQDHLFNISHGSGINNFPPMSFIKNLKIPLPPLPLQQKFASIVEQVEKLKEKQKQSKKEINQMFDVLMQKAFKGELV